MNVINPYNEQLVAVLRPTEVQELPEIASRAKISQKKWQKREFAERAAALKRFSELLSQNIEPLARNQTLETGKPINQARNEIKACNGRIEFFLENTQRQMQTQLVSNGGSTREELRFDPLGTILNISAWNYPYFVSLNVIVPALLCGNAVIYKPSEYASLVGQDMTRLLHEAGVPKDVFQLVLGGPACGEACLNLAVDGVFFTGSVATGKRIMSIVGPRMTPLGLELGGKDPAYVADDVDPIKAAIALADGAFYNAGQSCCAVERIYVHEGIYQRFVDAFVGQVKEFKMGDPLKEDTYIGPLTRRGHKEFLAKQLKDALDKGASLLAGDPHAKSTDQFFAPTVLVNVNHTMDVMREESFGPIIGIQKVKSDLEAIKLMDDSCYGLTSSVYCNDQSRAESILGELQSGSVYWNCCDRVSPFLPWSGRRLSGLGSTLGDSGIRAMLAPKAWHLRSHLL